MKNRTLTKKIALCGVMAALAMVFLYIGGLTVLDISVILICSLMTMIIMVETGEKMTWIYFAATSVLSLIILPSKLYAVEYILFGALYPIIKMHFEKLRSLFAWFLKISALDLMLLGCVVLGQFVFNMGEEYFPLTVTTMLLGTIFFVLFDITLTLCISFYMVKLRNKFLTK